MRKIEIKQCSLFGVFIFFFALLLLYNNVSAVTLTENQILEQAEYEVNITKTYPKYAYCMGFVADFFKKLGAPRESAYSAYVFSQKLGYNNNYNIPVGALVFFDGYYTYNGQKERVGHIGIYVGNDNFVSAVGYDIVYKNVKSYKTYNSSGGASHQYLGWQWYPNVTITKETPNKDPYGHLDESSGGYGTISVGGWAKDDDALNQSLSVHVYVGGPAGSGASVYGITANKSRPDVGGNYGFSETINVKERGTQTIYLYAINSPTGHNPLIGTATVNIADKIYGAEMSQGYDRALPDGDYIIAAAASPYYFLDIIGTEAANDNDNVNLWGVSNLDDISLNDIWTITYNSSNKFYSIRQKTSNMCLDVAGHSTAGATNIQAWHCTDYVGQRWAISRNGSNGYRLQPQCSGGGENPMALDIMNGNIANGTNVIQWTINNSDAQSWIFIPYKPSQPIDNGRYMILYSTDMTFEVDVEGNTGNIAENTNVQLWKDDTQNQYNSFDFIKLSNGYYKVRHAASGKCLDVSDGLSKYTTNVTLHTDNGSIAQQWAVIKNGYGYNLVARCNGYALDLPNGITGSGKNLNVYPWNNNPNQRWSFVKAEHTISFNLNGGSDGPQSQTKYYKNDLTLSSIVPKKSGSTFVRWEYMDLGVTYRVQPREKITIDQNLTLNAIWKENKCTVIFKVVNGSWDDGTTADKTVTLNGYEGDTLKLIAAQIPAVGNKPNTNYKEGSWDVVPGTSAAITQNTTYTYTYASSSAASSDIFLSIIGDAAVIGRCSNIVNEGTEYYISASPLASSGDSLLQDLKLTAVLESDMNTPAGTILGMDIEDSSGSRYACTVNSKTESGGTYVSCGSAPANGSLTGIYINYLPNSIISRGSRIVFIIQKQNSETELFGFTAVVPEQPMPCARNIAEKFLETDNGETSVIGVKQNCSQTEITLEYTFYEKGQHEDKFAIVNLMWEDSLQPDRFMINAIPDIVFDYKLKLTFAYGYNESSDNYSNFASLYYSFDPNRTPQGQVDDFSEFNAVSLDNYNLPLVLYSATLYDVNTLGHLSTSASLPAEINLPIKFWYDNVSGTLGYENSVFHFARSLSFKISNTCETTPASAPVEIWTTAQALYDHCQQTMQGFILNFPESIVIPAGTLLPYGRANQTAAVINSDTAENIPANEYWFAVRKCVSGADAPWGNDDVCEWITSTDAYPYQITVSDGESSSTTYKNGGRTENGITRFSMRTFGSDTKPFSISGMAFVVDEPGTYAVYAFVPYAEGNKTIPENYYARIIVMVNDTDSLANCSSLANNGYFETASVDKTAQTIQFSQIDGKDEAWISNSSPLPLDFPFSGENSELAENMIIAGLNCKFEALEEDARTGDGSCSPTNIHIPAHTKVTITGGTFKFENGLTEGDYRAAFIRLDTSNIMNLLVSVTDETKRIPGDMNGDGKVNVMDIVLLRDYFLKRGSGVLIVGNPDVDLSGSVNAMDSLLLRDFYLKRGIGIVIY